MNFDNCVNLLEHQSGLRLEEPIEGPVAWRRGEIGEADWKLPIPGAAVEEIERIVDELRRQPLPLYMLAPEHFQVAACTELMKEVKRRLTEGIGFVLLEGFPLKSPALGDLELDEVKAAYWVLARLLAPPVAAKLDGTVLYDIKDFGEAYRIGVRGSHTDKELEFHTDNTFAHAPPDFISLLCLHQAEEGGVSRIASFCNLHNELLAGQPEHLNRLYEPFYYDRQMEHHQGEARVSISRAFDYNGDYLRGRLSYNVMLQGYELMGEQMDPAGREALDSAYAIIDDPSRWVEHTLQRGQIQFVNNRALAHARTGFADTGGAPSKRHLLRFWYRESGRPFFNG